ncbi:MAG: hypothetical protein RLZZ383_2789 [Pseudomonadota bacterium]|jgi:lysophospholipase L1-like esterase
MRGRGIGNMALLGLCVVACAPGGGADAGGDDPDDVVLPVDSTGPADSSDATSEPSSPAPPVLPWAGEDPCARVPPSSGVWAGDVARFVAQDPVPGPARDRVVAVGSSSIRRWETAWTALAPWGVIQRGIGGAVLADVVAHLDDLVVRHRPAAVLLFAGTNDIAGGASADDVVQGWRCVVTRIWEAQGPTPVLFVGVTPTPARWAQWAVASEANARIADDVRAQPMLAYIDVPSLLLATAAPGMPPDASYFDGDGLHLSPAGYAVWDAAVADAMSQALPPRATPPPGPPAGRRLRVDLGPANPEDGWLVPTTDGFGIAWNAWTSAAGGLQVLAGEALRGLVDTTGQVTGVDLVIAGGFRANGLRNGGLVSPPGDLLQTLAVPEATADFFYIENADDPGALAWTGLTPGASHTVRLFASRATDEERRRTGFTAVGGGPPVQGEVVTSGADIGRDGYDGNDADVTVLEDVVADAWGQIVIDVRRVEGRFAYLNLIELEVDP